MLHFLTQVFGPAGSLNLSMYVAVHAALALYLIKSLRPESVDATESFKRALTRNLLDFCLYPKSYKRRRIFQANIILLLFHLGLIVLKYRHSLDPGPGVRTVWALVGAYLGYIFAVALAKELAKKLSCAQLMIQSLNLDDAATCQKLEAFILQGTTASAAAVPPSTEQN